MDEPVSRSRFATNITVHVLYALRFVKHRERAVVVSDNSRRKQLHRVVMLDRDEILRFMSHGRSSKGLRNIPTRLVGLFDHIGFVYSRVQIGRVFLVVVDVHQSGREASGL